MKYLLWFTLLLTCIGLAHASCSDYECETSSSNPYTDFDYCVPNHQLNMLIVGHSCSAYLPTTCEREADRCQDFNFNQPGWTCDGTYCCVAGRKLYNEDPYSTDSSNWGCEQVCSSNGDFCDGYDPGLGYTCNGPREMCCQADWDYDTATECVIEGTNYVGQVTVDGKIRDCSPAFDPNDGPGGPPGTCINTFVDCQDIGDTFCKYNNRFVGQANINDILLQCEGSTENSVCQCAPGTEPNENGPGCICPAGLEWQKSTGTCVDIDDNCENEGDACYFVGNQEGWYCVSKDDEGLGYCCGLAEQIWYAGKCQLPTEFCNDGIDNDDNGKIDYEDEGCECDGIRDGQHCYECSIIGSQFEVGDQIALKVDTQGLIDTAKFTDDCVLEYGGNGETYSDCTNQFVAFPSNEPYLEFPGTYTLSFSSQGLQLYCPEVEVSCPIGAENIDGVCRTVDYCDYQGDSCDFDGEIGYWECIARTCQCVPGYEWDNGANSCIVIEQADAVVSGNQVHLCGHFWNPGNPEADAITVSRQLCSRVTTTIGDVYTCGVDANGFTWFAGEGVPDMSPDNSNWQHLVERQGGSNYQSFLAQGGIACENGAPVQTVDKYSPPPNIEMTQCHSTQCYDGTECVPAGTENANNFYSCEVINGETVWVSALSQLAQSMLDNAPLGKDLVLNCGPRDVSTNAPFGGAYEYEWGYCQLGLFGNSGADEIRVGVSFEGGLALESSNAQLLSFAEEIDKVRDDFDSSIYTDGSQSIAQEWLGGGFVQNYVEIDQANGFAYFTTDNTFGSSFSERFRSLMAQLFGRSGAEVVTQTAEHIFVKTVSGTTDVYAVEFAETSCAPLEKRRIVRYYLGGITEECYDEQRWRFIIQNREGLPQ